MAFVGIQVDTTAYGQALLRWREFSKRSFAGDIRAEARLLGQMLIRLTPPNSQAQGRAAVKRDIGYIADGISDSFFHHMAGRHGMRDVQQTIRTADGSAKMFVDWGEMCDDFSRLKQYHRSQRTRRGRVNRGSRIHVTPERWEVKNALVVPRSLKDRYVQYEQGFVGAAKGGWAVGTIALGGRAPAWVSRHANATFGGFRDDTGSERPSFTFFNRSPWAGSGEEALRITRDAVRIRTENIDKRIAAAQQHAARQAGFVIRNVVSAARAAEAVLA